MTVDLKAVINGVPQDLELAIVIAGSLVTGSKDQRHAGFLVQYPDYSLWLFDLAWDNICRKEKMTAEYAYLNRNFLDPFNATAIIASLHMIQSENRKSLGYSIHYEEGSYFDPATGKGLKTNPGQGLTCATFVIETLEKYGINLIDRASWPITQENSEWQRGILNLHISRTRPPLSIEKFTSQFKYIGKTRRFRPEEAIGAASIFSGVPIPYYSAAPAAQAVLTELERLHLL